MIRRPAFMPDSNGSGVNGRRYAARLKKPLLVPWRPST
ncbi:hypothetical protein C4K03_4720 [Pseudomonas synxantha]|uniref:Uncharacterized protein n=1 Tax=Pseudomonas synxantha TaxID=47883 RepID=A0A3G7UE64_9PSED|nr:hypothetical protein C4K03_4720 [Pseudomonas synxantha]